MVTWNDFEKIWASTSPLTPYEFSEPNYSQGWNFVGSTPPARQMWDSIQKKNDEKFKYLRDNFGTPNIVTSSSQMTDTEKVYVYMGSEEGWNSGHWYYYDEGTSSWADGGVYNSVAFVTDPTLSIAGQPADAKAVGDALALKADLAGCTFTGNVNVSADLSVTGTSTLAGDVTASSDLSVAGDSALTNLSVSGTTALAGTSTAPTPSADDNSTKIATTEYVQTEIKPIETDVTINDKRISNIEKLLQGNLYDYQTDSTSAYTKSVPSGAMPYAGLEKIGGKTIVYNNLVDATSDASGAGITKTYTDGVYRFTGTATSGKTFYFSPNSTHVIAGHKYYIGKILNYTSDGTSTRIQVNSSVPGTLLEILTTINSVGGVIVTANYTGTYANYYFTVGAGETIDVSLVPLFIDLTLMFGSGNEPTTVAEFEAIFPANSLVTYPYNAGTLLSAGVTEVESKGINILDPTQIVQGSITGSGGNIGALNRLRTPFIPVVEGETYTISCKAESTDPDRILVYEVDFYDATVNWTNWSYRTLIQFSADVTIPSGIHYIKILYKKYNDKTLYPSELKDPEVIKTSTYSSYPIPTAIRNLEGYGWSCPEHYNYIDYEAKKYVQEVGSRAYASGDESDTTVITDGTNTYYALSPAVETDISQYITDDNLISVESGGTLTFPNSNGDDYQIPVPSEETYMIDLQEAINNG